MITRTIRRTKGGVAPVSSDDLSQGTATSSFKGLRKRIRLWIYVTWFNFAVRYRSTFLGPLWVLVGPSLFIGLLGLLFSRVNHADSSVFIPHLTVGLVVWTLISGFLSAGTTVFQRNRAQILQGGMSLIDIVMTETLSTILLFLHQLVIIIFVFVLMGVKVTFYSFLSAIGLLLVIVNGLWLTMFVGIIGARYRDLKEIVDAVMRIAFLATPIIWMPGSDERSAIVSTFLNFNPFYHFLELVRAPLLSQPIKPLSVFVVLSITAIGMGLAYVFHARFKKALPLWV